MKNLLRSLFLAIPLVLVSPLGITVAQSPVPVTLDDLTFNYVNEGSNRWGVIEIVDGAHVLLPCSNDGLPSSRMAEDTAKECLVKYVMLYHDVVPKREFRAISYEMVRLDYNEAAAQTMRVIAGPQGVNSEYPDGSEPTGGTSCSATWTSVAIGDGTEECEEVSATAVTLTGSGTNEYTGYAFAYKTESSASDMQFDVTMPVTSSWTGTNESFTMGGCMFREGTAANDYNFLGARAFGSAMLYKAVENQALITNGTGTAGTGLPRQVRCWYDHSASELKAFEYNGSSWDQIGTTVTKSLTFPMLYGAFVTSHTTAATTTIPITAMTYTTTLDTGGGGPAPPIDRQVDWGCSGEDGQLNARSSGSLDCSVTYAVTELASSGTLSITDITEADPAVITYTGTDPSNGTAYYITGVTGMTEINGQLVYVQNVNTTANTFQAAVVNDPEWNGNGGDTVASLISTLRLDASGYSNYTSGGTLTPFDAISDSSGGFGPASSNMNKIVDSGSNSVGSDTNVTCRQGDYCFKSHIGYHYANFSNNKNKPRMSLRPAEEWKLDYDVPAYTSISIYVPTGTCTDNAGGQQGILLMNRTGDSASQDQFHLNLGRPTTGGTNQFTVQYSRNTSSPNQSFVGGATNIAPATEGKWHDFVIYTDTNATNGTLRVWHNEADGGTAGDTAELVFEVDGTGYGNQQSGTKLIGGTYRQYYFTWKNQSTNCQNDSVEFLFDEMYKGDVANGTSFSDVHPGGQSEP